MNEEKMKEICKAYHYNYPMEKIAEIEDVSINDVKKAIEWGHETKYLKDLGGRME